MAKKYIGKYDFFQYFNRPKDHWLIESAVIEEFIKEKTLQLVKNSNIPMFDDESDDGDEEDFEKEPIDSYEIYKQNKECQEKLKEDDPAICEGIRIDQASRNYIKSLYPECKSIDVSELYISLEERAALTLKHLKENENVILFQSCFIYKDKATAMPDAIIKKTLPGGDIEFTLIETKGTTTTKACHLVDIYYQLQIINPILEEQFGTIISKEFLCIVKYELCKRNTLSLVLVDKCYPTKGGMSTKCDSSGWSFEDICKFKSYAKENCIKPNNDYDNDCYKINNLLSAGESWAPPPKNATTKKNAYLKVYNDFFVDKNKFWKIIDELLSHHKLNVEEISLAPAKCFKQNNLKPVEYWNSLRDYYYFSNNPDYYPVQFSGNLIPYKYAILLYEKFKGTNKPFEDFFPLCYFELEKMILSNSKSSEGPSKACKKYYDWLFTNNNLNSTNGMVFGQDAINFLNKLRTKKVYFDFESLNTATRVVDDYPPFMQTVNQVSVIIDDGHGVENLREVPYVVIDPLKGIGGNGMTKEDFKKIIDAILPSKDLKECSEYSYVVYNKSFECTRLNEMKKYINEPEYNQKVDIINQNIYDIADLFDLRKTPIVFKELKGYYSIKKVLPMVKKYYPEVWTLTKCKDYKTELNIHNGGDAQSASTKRFFGKLSDEEWEKVVEDLGLYCNNDVRAMIAVEYLAKAIVKSFSQLI